MCLTPSALGRIQHLPRLIDGHRQRLFAEHVQTPLDSLHREVTVKAVRCRDNHGIDVGIAQKRERIAPGGADAAGA